MIKRAGGEGMDELRRRKGRRGVVVVVVWGRIIEQMIPRIVANVKVKVDVVVVVVVVEGVLRV